MLLAGVAKEGFLLKPICFLSRVYRVVINPGDAKNVSLDVTNHYIPS